MQGRSDRSRERLSGPKQGAGEVGLSGSRIRNSGVGAFCTLSSIYFASPVFAQTETAPATRPGGAPLWIGNIFLFGSFILIFYFLILRPQQKRQREHRNMLEGLKTGDRVLTSGGMYGTVVSVKDDIVNLRVGDNVRIDVAKSAVTSILPDAK